MLYVYGTLWEGVEKDGLDINRYQPGLAIQHVKTVQENVEKNLALNRASPLYPPVVPDKMTRSTFALSHMTLLQRCYKHKMQMPRGGRFNANTEDEDHMYVIANGLRFYLLSEDTTKEEIILLSEWRNADQDQNLSTREGALFNTMDTLLRALPCPEMVKLGQFSGIAFKLFCYGGPTN